jgi:hypothetical protein
MRGTCGEKNVELLAFLETQRQVGFVIWPCMPYSTGDKKELE